MRGLANTAYQDANFEEAIKWYEKWLSLDPKNADAAAGLKQAKQRQADITAATTVATKFFKKLDDGEVSETRTMTGTHLVAAFNSGEVTGGIKPMSKKTDEQEKKEWVEFLGKYREPLGKTIERKLEAVKYTHDRKSVGTAGDQIHAGRGFNGGFSFMNMLRTEPDIVLQFNTKYENKRNVVELLSLGKSDEGDWKINAYGLQDTEAPRDPLKD